MSVASHTGGTLGASNARLVLPEEMDGHYKQQSSPQEQGMIVSIIYNMQSVDLNGIALQIILEFYKDRLDTWISLVQNEPG